MTRRLGCGPRGEDERLLKPTIRRAVVGDWWDGPRPWRLDVPDQGAAHSTVEFFATFEDAVAGLADWWARGNRASFLRHPGSGRDRRREAAAFIAAERKRAGR